MDNCYDVLGVPSDADPAQVKAAWLAAARRLHPDMNPDDPASASARFRQARAAYQTLADPARRAEHDLQWGHVSPAPPQPHDPPARRHERRPPFCLGCEAPKFAEPHAWDGDVACYRCDHCGAVTGADADGQAAWPPAWAGAATAGPQPDVPDAGPAGMSRGDRFAAVALVALVALALWMLATQAPVR